MLLLVAYYYIAILHFTCQVFNKIIYDLTKREKYGNLGQSYYVRVLLMLKGLLLLLEGLAENNIENDLTNNDEYGNINNVSDRKRDNESI